MRGGADVDFQAAWAHVRNQEHQVSPRGASDWWRESVRKSVSVHQDKIRGSAICSISVCLGVDVARHASPILLHPSLDHVAPVFDNSRTAEGPFGWEKWGTAERSPRKQTWHIPFGVSELGGDVLGCALRGARRPNDALVTPLTTPRTFWATLLTWPCQWSRAGPIQEAPSGNKSLKARSRTHPALAKLQNRFHRTKQWQESFLTRGNAAQTQCHLDLRHCPATPKQLLCLFPTPFSPTPQGGNHRSPVQSPLRSVRHADHSSRRRTSGTTARGFKPPPTLCSRAPTSFAPEESPASRSSVWLSAPAPAAPPCPRKAAVGVAAASAWRRRRATSAAPARRRATPRCQSWLGVRPTGGPRPIGWRGGRCEPVAAVEWGGGVPTLRWRRPSGRLPAAVRTRAHAQRRRGAPAGGEDDNRQWGAG